MSARHSAAARAGRYSRAGRRWARLVAGRVREPGVRVFYGHDRVPDLDEPAAGGTSKFQKLAARFPNSPSDFSLLYLGSSSLPRDLRQLLWLARRRACPVVLNQDGVGYPGWAGPRTVEVNRPLRHALRAADHVLYQSEYCRRSADVFLGPTTGSSEVLYNAVDVERFQPSAAPSADGPVLLLGGDQTQSYRLELALRTLAALVQAEPGARLVVAGRLVTDPNALLDELGIRDRVELVGRYSQAEAPALYGRAHVLLHTKVNDPCPNVVLEAMACGLPVVYAASGGTVELVGDEAGVGVPHPDGFDRDEPPPAEAMAEAVVTVLAGLDRYREAARRRAVERFPLEPWLEHHAQLFETLVS